MQWNVVGLLIAMLIVPVIALLPFISAMVVGGISPFSIVTFILWLVSSIGYFMMDQMMDSPQTDNLT